MIEWYIESCNEESMEKRLWIIKAHIHSRSLELIEYISSRFVYSTAALEKVLVFSSHADCQFLMILFMNNKENYNEDKQQPRLTNEPHGFYKKI